MNSDRQVATRAHASLPVTLNGEQSLGPLVRQLARDSSTLVRQEIALAKAEVRQSVGQAANGAIKLGVAAGFLLVGSLVLTAFLVVLLGGLIGNYWLAALIVGLVFTIIGALLALSGARQLKRVSLAPETALENLKDDAAWAQAELRQAKRDLKSRQP